MKKVYLGDGLYAENDGFGFWLTAENGISVLEKVYLEPQVLDSFLKYVEKISNVKITVERLKDEKTR